MASQASQFPTLPTAVPTSTVLTETFDGIPGGSNLALPQQELDDTQARQLWDWLVDKPGLTRQRGPIRPVTGMHQLSRMGTGIVLALDPQGTSRYAVLNGDGSNGYLTVWSDDLGSTTDLAWPYPLPQSPYRIVDSKPALGGGVIIGVSDHYDAVNPQQGVAFWFGANKPNWTSTITVTRGALTVSGTGFNANVVPGMFLFANTDGGYSNAFIGTVLKVNNDSQLTLTKPAWHGATSLSGTFQSLRGIAPQVTTGRITCDVSSTTVTGGATKFKSQGLDSGTWQLYRQSDGAFVGKVQTVNSDISITLTANAAVSMADEAYTAVRADADFSIINTANVNKVGFLNATYAGRQWFANLGTSVEGTTKGWFSDENNFEGLDLSAFDGNWIEITSQGSSVNEALRAIAPAYNGLLWFKETETFVLTGESPDSFEIRKLEDDGVLSGMSVQQYAGGVIWAGREGIQFYDGIQTTNLVEETLGDWWKSTIRTLDPTTYRMWSMVERDHYFLFLESATPPIPQVRGNVSTTPSRLTIVINLITRAVTFATNLNIIGAITLPASASRAAWYLVNGQVSGDSSDHAIICDAEAIFKEEGPDPVTCQGDEPGPQIYLESKTFDASDGMRLKRFKQVSMYYLAQGGVLTMDIVLGLNEVGSTLSTTFPESVPSWTQIHAAIATWADMAEQYSTWSTVVQSVFIPKRLRSSKKSQFMSFRLYGTPSTLTRAKIGPYSIAYKLGRPGRVS